MGRSVTRQQPVGSTRGSVKHEALATRFDQPTKRRDRWIPPTVFVGGHNGLRRACAPRELGLGQSLTTANCDKEVRSFHVNQYIALSMLSAG